MTDVNKAELRRLVQMLRDNADQCACAGFSSSLQDKAANAVILLLDECDKLQADTSSMRGSLRSYAENMKKQVRLNTRLHRERDSALAELEACRKDAERWRFVRSPIGTRSPYAIWNEGRMPVFGKIADACIDDAIRKEALDV